jgi:ribosomal protein S27AE
MKACPNCGSEANWDWHDGGEAMNYEADDLMGCGQCGHVQQVERERAAKNIARNVAKAAHRRRIDEANH